MSAIAVAVSGGVDSLAALLLLRASGGRVIAVHGLFRTEAAVPDGLAVLCADLGIPFHVVDLREIFAQKVQEYFVTAHIKGCTPNPCAICNKEIKFGALLNAIKKFGCERMATGHYAQLDQSGGQLLCACDSTKDQTYFLSLLSERQLRAAVFPLGTRNKTEICQFVASCGYTPSLPAESQDSCFLSGMGKGEYLRKYLPAKSGPICLAENGKEIGRHAGLWHYTIGQRRGLGIAWQYPLYVRRIDVQNNTLEVAPRESVQMRGCMVSDVNFLVPPTDWPEEVSVKVRYNQPKIPARVSLDGSRLHIKLLRPTLSTAPGQIAALYDKRNRVLAGAIVEAVEFG